MESIENQLSKYMDLIDCESHEFAKIYDAVEFILKDINKQLTVEKTKAKDNILQCAIGLKINAGVNYIDGAIDLIGFKQEKGNNNEK